MAHRQPSDYRFESEIQQDVLLEFGSGKPMRIWRNNVAKAYPVSMIQAIKKGQSCRPIAFGVVGSADILGILYGDIVTGNNRGRSIGIEIKMPGQKLRPEQVVWRDMWLRAGGVHILATCIEDVYVGLEKEGIHCR